MLNFHLKDKLSEFYLLTKVLYYSINIFHKHPSHKNKYI